MSEIKRYKFNFTGRVQGVGFRYTACSVANMYRLTGYVKNEYDGSVCVEVQGPDSAIAKFLEAINANRYIKIYGINQEIIPIEEGERGFITQY